MNLGMSFTSMLLFTHFVGSASEKPNMLKLDSLRDPKSELTDQTNVVEPPDFEWEHLVPSTNDEDAPLVSLKSPLKQENVLLTRSECDKKGDHETSIDLGQKIKGEIIWTKKDRRDEELFWGLYNGVWESVSKHVQVSSELPDQIQEIINKNPRLLYTTRPTKSPQTKRTGLELISPLIAYTQVLLHPNINYSVFEKDRLFFTRIFDDLLSMDTDNVHRVQVLRHFVRAGQVKRVEAFLKEKINISQHPELITDLMDAYCIKAHVMPVDAPSAFFPWIKPQSPKYVKLTQKKLLPVKKEVFQENNFRHQVDAMAIARWLVKKGAPLSAIDDNFPPVAHAKLCASCAYLRNKMLDQREAAQVPQQG